MKLRPCFVVFRDRSILSSCVHLRGTFLWSFRALLGLRMSLCGRVMSVFLAQKTLFLLALASAKRIGELHALSYRVSHTRDWGEVSFAFVTSFVAKTQDPSSLAPRFEGLQYRPYQTRERIAMGDYCVLCGQSRFTSTALLHIVHDVSGCLSPQGVARRRFRRPRSPSGSGRRYHALTSSLGLHCLCLPPELERLVVSLRQFFFERILLSTRC